MAIPPQLTLQLPTSEAAREELLKDVCEIEGLPVEIGNAKPAVSKIVIQRINNFKKKKQREEAEKAKEEVEAKEITPTEIS